MDNSSNSHTRPTLLARLRAAETDQAAWSEFVEIYTPKILGWCRRWHLQQADAEDVTQDVLLKLHRSMRSFVYDPRRGSFRGWLRRITANAWKDFLSSHQRADAGSGDSQVMDRLLSEEAREDWEQTLKEMFDLELLEEAKACVQLRVKPHVWETFRLLTWEGKSPRDIANQLNIQLAMVYVYKQRVTEMLAQEIRRLNGESSGK